MIDAPEKREQEKWPLPPPIPNETGNGDTAEPRVFYYDDDDTDDDDRQDPNFDHNAWVRMSPAERAECNAKPTAAEPVEQTGNAADSKGQPSNVNHTTAEPKSKTKRNYKRREPRATGETEIARRFKALHLFRNESLRKLPRTAGLVWLMMWSLEFDGTVTVTQKTLAEQMGVEDEDTVWRAISLLRRLGYVTVQDLGRLNKGPSRYRLHPVPEQ